MSRHIVIALLWILYGAWLVAGAIDYLCHRRTNIEQTSGEHESWLHMAQFACLLLSLTIALLFDGSRGTLAAVAAGVAAHSVLALVDVSYTDGLRRIPPLEQYVHGWLELLPLFALALLVLLQWDAYTGPDASWAWSLRPGLGSRGELLLVPVSFLVLAGGPIFEEWLRTRRARSRRSSRESPAVAQVRAR